MNKRTLQIRNLTLLTGFAAVFSVLTFFAVRTDRLRDSFATPTEYQREVISSMASTFSGSAKVSVVRAPEDAMNALTAEGNGDIASPRDPQSDSSLAMADGTGVSSDTLALAGDEPLYTVTEYETPLPMYASATVNVRNGAGTDYDKIGKLSWGSRTDVTGETDNGWYEVSYNGAPAFVRGDFMITELPGTPLLFVGDSRTVQLRMAVGDSDKAYIAEVGEGYNYFKNTALPAIQSYAGHGTRMIINFGVNDLTNIDNYIELVNNNIDKWSDAGISVYYASVTPVSSYPTVTNAQIEAFNKKLKSSLDSRVKWIDGYTYLSRNGFGTPDGLHYTPETYKKLYSYYLSVIDQI